MHSHEHCTGCRRERVIGLIGGNSVCSYCDEWRKECLQRDKSSRVLMSIGTIAQRQAWLKNYESVNGPLAAQRLRDVFAKMWREK